MVAKGTLPSAKLIRQVLNRPSPIRKEAPPMATLIQLIKTVLDDLYRRIDIDAEAEKDELIKAEIRAISKAYRNVEAAPQGTLDFSNPVKRFAYI